MKTIEKIGKIASNIFLGFTIIVLVYSIYLIIESENTGEEVFLFGYKPYIIQTGSMEPTLKVNSLTIVKKGGFEEIESNDIVTYKLIGFDKNVCHRVIAIENNKLITKGDNNEKPDEKRVGNDIYIGKVVYNSNITSYILNTFETPDKAIKTIIPITVLIIIIIIAIKVILKNRYKGKRIKEKE